MSDSTHNNPAFNANPSVPETALEDMFNRFSGEQANNLTLGSSLPYGIFRGATNGLRNNPAFKENDLAGGVLSESGDSKGADISKQTTPQDYSKIKVAVNSTSPKYGLDPLLVMCLIKAESNFRIRCYTPNKSGGAYGLMQLIPETAAEAGYSIADMYVIEKNIDAGCKELNKYMKSHSNNINLALASYNAGPGNVKKYGGIPPFKETQDYVAKITRDYNNAKTGVIRF